VGTVLALRDDRICEGNFETAKEDFVPQLTYDKEDFRKRNLVIKLEGKDYLTVNGRYILAHESNQLIGMRVEIVDHDDDWITFRATASVFNPTHIETVKRIREECGEEIARDLARCLLINEFDGWAKSPREGSDAWNALSPRSSERTRPLEKAATDAAGRALSAAGFGEAESFANGEEVVSALARGDAYEKTAQAQALSDKQRQYIAMLAKNNGLSSKAELDAYVRSLFGKGVDQLDRRDATKLITALKDGVDKQEDGEHDEPPF